jgi:CheY-like chemotaxis protein
MGRNRFFVLIVDSDPGAGAAWSQAVDQSRLDKQVYLVHTPAQAIEYILKVHRSPSLTTPGVLLVQSEGGPDSIALIVRWLQSQQSLAWVIPVALINAGSKIDITSLYDAGARSCLPAPASTEDRINLLSEIRNYWKSLNVWPKLGFHLGAGP